MQSNRDKILNWAASGHIAKADLQGALVQGKAEPDLSEWLAFCKLSVLWLAAICCCSAAIFFFAYNWQYIPRLYKFALLEVSMLVVAASYLIVARQAISRTVLLMVFSLLTGALLALVGQTYQTGADPWQLFAYWGLFILPWVVVARASALWIFWVALLNLATVLYLSISIDIFSLFSTQGLAVAMLFSLNLVLLAIFELLSFQPVKTYLGLTFSLSNNRYSQQFLACVTGYYAAHMAIYSLLESDAEAYLLLFYGGWLAISLLLYRWVIKDLLMLAITALSFIAVSTFFVSYLLFEFLDIGFLLVAGLYTVGVSAFCFSWLKKTAAHFESSAITAGEQA